MATLAGSTANTVIVAVQALILTPLCLHFVGARLYGAWLASGDVLVWMQAFDLGLPNLLIQRIGVADGARDDKTIAEYFATGCAFLLLLAAGCVAAGVALSWFLPEWLKLTGSEAAELRQCFQLAAILAGVLVANNAVVGLARGLQDTTWINASLVLSALAGFGTSTILILSGYGLWAIPLGMAARATTVTLGSVTYLWFRIRPQVWRNLRFSRGAVIDFARASPATTCAGFAFASMNQCDNVLAGLVLGPEVVPVLALTRKGADVARSVLDPISYSSYAGFAHLIGSEDRKRARQVHDEIGSIRLSLAVAAAAAFIAVNRQLVSVWVGPAMFGGFALTLIVGVHSIVVGSSYLMNSLYRATGAIVRGSVALVVESATRIPLIVAGLLMVGLTGPSIAGIITASMSAIVMHRWTHRALPADLSPSRGTQWRLWIVRAAILVAGVVVALIPAVPSWTSVLGRGLGLSALGVGLLLWADPSLAGVVHALRRRLTNSVHSSAAIA
jgi:O-antigen/teichoic acid export membrane protein